MPTSAALIDHLAGNVTSIVPLWSITAVDGTAVYYAQHTRNLVFNGHTYVPSSVETTKVSQNIGLKPNNVQLMGIFDDSITRDNLEAGKWKQAAIRFEYVNYLDLTMGSTGVIRGVVGKVDIIGVTYKIEVRSLASVLGQTIGELTSPIDRADWPIGVDKAPYTITRAVTTPITSRRIFTINGAAFTDHFYRYGVLTFTSGANNGLKMEIQENIGNLLTLQIPMPYTVAAGNTVTLLAGYDGTRDQLRDRFGAVVGMNAEPDLPGIKKVLAFPE